MRWPCSLDLRLARRLLAEADEQGVVAKTHQQLALDLGSVREVISRYLAEWERMGWVHASRGSIEVRNRRRWQAMAGGNDVTWRAGLTRVGTVTWVTDGPCFKLKQETELGDPQTSKDIKTMTEFLSIGFWVCRPAPRRAMALAAASPAPAAEGFDDQCTMGLASGRRSRPTAR